MERTVSFGGDSNIGVFVRVFDDIAVVPPTAPGDFREVLSDILGVEIVETSLQGSEIVGSLLAGNRHGFVVSGFAGESEIARLSEYRELCLLEHTMNAAGNIILANDSLALVHPDMPETMAKEISEILRTPVHRITLAGIKTVGMAAVASNRGIMVHPRTSRHEMARLESLTDLPIGTGSVNMGSGLVGTGLVANSRGYVAGMETTGFELGRIEDIFGFLER
ncbi:MAG: translation initiation factor IF-6 [Methanoregulaceae archaeon]|nr:translation initiation factor IF-6 [Methanoregulaceae archaeon]